MLKMMEMGGMMGVFLVLEYLVLEMDERGGGPTR
jgi:hypothetical protein